MSRGVVPSRSRLALPLPLPLPLTPASTGRRSSAASPSPHTGSRRRSPDVASWTTEEQNENEDGRAFDDFEEKAFFVLGKTTRPRNWCITVVLWPYPFLCCNYLQSAINFHPLYTPLFSSFIS